MEGRGAGGGSRHVSTSSRSYGVEFNGHHGNVVHHLILLHPQVPCGVHQLQQGRRGELG